LKISIITVCYNSAETIRDTIQSALEQDYSNIEYIIVDGASNDGTLSIIQEYTNQISKVISEPDKGIYDAMNKGIQLATGDVIGILNSDDFFDYPSVVSDIANQFKLNTKVDLIFGDLVFVQPSDLHKIVRFYNSDKFRAWKLRFGWMPPHTASFIKRTVYEQVGLFNLKYKIAADYEFFVRMLLVYKLPYSRFNKVLIRMRIGGLSTSGIRNSLLLNNEIVKACRDNGIYTNLFFVLFKIPFKIIEFFKMPKDNV